MSECFIRSEVGVTFSMYSLGLNPMSVRPGDACTTRPMKPELQSGGGLMLRVSRLSW